MLGRKLSVVLSVVLSLTLTQFGAAQEAKSGAQPSADLPALARKAAKEFKPATAKEVQAARQEARSALRHLEHTLARNPVAVREDWYKHLHLKDLRAKLDAQEAKSAELSEAISHFSGDQSGLEWKHFTNVRDAVKTYADLLSVVEDPKAAETHATALEELAKQLEAHGKTPTPESWRAVGRGLGHLRRTRQAPELVKAVDAQHTLPNLRLEASHKLLAAGIEQDVDQQTTVVDNVVGTTVQSNVHLKGDVKLKLVPSTSDGLLRLLLSGTAHSNSVGWKGPVTIYSTGVTSVSAQKDLRINELGFLADPASASCATSTNVNGISAKCNMIRKMAWKKVGKSKGQAEAEASRRAASRVAAQLDRESQEMLDKSNDSFQQKFRARLARRGQLPRQMQFGTSEELLSLVMLQSGDHHVGAPAALPALPAARDLNVRLHESFVGNLSEAAVGGMTLTDEKLAELLQEMAGEVPEELKIGEDKDPWSITFATEHPVQVTFTDKNLTVVVNGRRFTRGEGNSRREIRDPARIVATYTVAKTASGGKLTRQGEVEVEYTNLKGSQSATQIAFKTFLRRKFDSLFKAEIASEGIQLKGRWENAGKLLVQDIQLSPGWIVLGWNLAGKTEAKVASND